MKNSIKSVITLGFLSLLTALISASAPSRADVTENELTHDIRIFCYYVPQGGSETSKKLMEGGKPFHVMAKEEGSNFVVPKETFLGLLDKCIQFIPKTDYFTLLKGQSSSEHYETLGYGIKPISLSEDVLAQQQVIEDAIPEALTSAGITAQDRATLSAALKGNSGTLLNMARALGSNVAYTAEKAAQFGIATGKVVGTIVTNPYVNAALIIAIWLANIWFPPVYVAGAVDLLYPMVYGAMFGGVPGKLSAAYWLVYYPGKMHAIAWAYNNSTAILNIGAAAIGGGIQLVKWFFKTKPVTQKSATEDLNFVATHVSGTARDDVEALMGEFILIPGKGESEVIITVAQMEKILADLNKHLQELRRKDFLKIKASGEAITPSTQGGGT